MFEFLSSILALSPRSWPWRGDIKTPHGHDLNPKPHGADGYAEGFTGSCTVTVVSLEHDESVQNSSLEAATVHSFREALFDPHQLPNGTHRDPSDLFPNFLLDGCILPWARRARYKSFLKASESL
jgi:hypothetical protein